MMDQVGLSLGLLSRPQDGGSRPSPRAASHPGCATQPEGHPSLGEDRWQLAASYRGSQDAPVKSADDGILAGTNAELPVDSLGMGLYRVLRQAEFGGNLGECQRPAQQPEHSDLTLREVVRQGSRFRPGDQARIMTAHRHSPASGHALPGSGEARASPAFRCLSLQAISGLPTDGTFNTN